MDNKERARVIECIKEQYVKDKNLRNIFWKPYTLSFEDIFGEHYSLRIDEDGILITETLTIGEIPWESLDKEYVGFKYTPTEEGFRVRLLETKYVKILSRNTWPSDDDYDIFQANIRDIEEQAAAYYDWIGENTYPKRRRLYLIKSEYLDPLFGICFTDPDDKIL